MICYTIRCAKGHEFEGWFRNSATYDEQAKSGDVRCPECGSVKVAKAPMAPSVARSGQLGTETISAREAAAAEKASDKTSENKKDGGNTTQPAALPATADANRPSAPPSEKMVHHMGKVREALVEIRRYVEANSDYVGDKFVDEARKIHSGDAEERSIYGEASEEEAEELSEEGISVGRIPWVRKTDS